MTGTTNCRDLSAHCIVLVFLMVMRTEWPGTNTTQPQARCSAGLKEAVVGRTEERRREVRKRRRKSERKGEKKLCAAR